ncbi:tyrosine-protein phosphatase [Nocardia terpenica]|uniref:Protein-tyrosine-phosphatase n=1 Tax=Nocardia terpenica TaxID=455432 RepID=A0A6G9ZBT6_9NOCA|nr:tyrosine-protein phosphatase [Nocardia terpenica]QIS22463.1 protein-tyrosine-phosphatase [Nocardia terpenica]
MTAARPDQYLLSGSFNYRDVGGLHTSSGSRLRSGVLMRSAHLCRLDCTGKDRLRGVGVATVHDLRGPDEIRYLGADVLPPGVKLELSPFDSGIGRKPPHEVVYNDGWTEMLQVYRSFPTMPEAGVAITRIAESIVRGDGAVLVHCAAGKDRTGWAIATLLRAVGVAESEVLEDFLRSNDAIGALRADVELNSGGRAVLPPEVLGVSSEYLGAGTDSMQRVYGDLEGYLASIGLRHELREELKQRLLD